jgi:ABC-type transporter MlaC component
MTPETIAALIQSGSAGLVIIVILIFLYYMDKRDKVYTGAMDKITIALDKLSGEQVQLRIDVKGHHESVEQMTKNVIDATRNCNSVVKKKEGGAWG